MKERLKKLLTAAQKRMGELDNLEKGEKITVDELRSINSERKDLMGQISDLEASIAELETEEQRQAADKAADKAQGEQRGAQPQGGLKPLGTYGVGTGQKKGQERKNETDEDSAEKAEERGKALKEMRSITLSSTGVILPNYQANDIKPTFNEVSSLVDRINIKVLPGGESFKQAYSTGFGEADYATEGGNPADAEPGFGYAQINKTKVAAYAEDSEEIVKLPGANYDAEVQKGIRIASRKKLTKEILIGDGASGHFVGIFDDGATAIDAAKDIEIGEIDETTLDEIIYSFGGDEDVEDVAVLVLNKKDLKAFAMLRDADGKKIYDVKPRGNVGTIDGVPYIINSNCKAVSAAATTSGQYAMAYGPLSNYTMAIFSDLEISRSTDYKFKEGMIAHRGVIFAGGNVTAKNGFLRVKKA